MLICQTPPSSIWYHFIYHISYNFMYIDDRWFSKHVPSVPHLLWTMSQTQQLQQLPAAPTAPAGCAWRAGGDLPRAWDGLDHEGHLGRVLLRRQLRLGGNMWQPGRLGSLIYMILCDFICNMNLCCTIWLYLSLYDPIILLSLLYDFKWWYDVLHGRFNLETWNYLWSRMKIPGFSSDEKNPLDPRRKAMVIAWVS